MGRRRSGMKHRALNTAILVLVFVTAAAAQDTKTEQLHLDAEQGDAKAQNNLGVTHNNGEGAPQDYVQSHKWINLAASRMNPGKEDDLDYRSARDEVAKKLTASQVAEAQRLAREWQPQTWEQLKGK